MSEEQAQGEDGSGQEPSMEDILASIRRILSEDEEEGGEEEVAAAPEPEPEPEPAPEPELEASRSRNPTQFSSPIRSSRRIHRHRHHARSSRPRTSWS